MRISAPKGEFKEESTGTKIYSGEKIIITAGGAVFFDDSNNISIGCRLYSPLIFTCVNDECPYKLTFLASYLKSSIVLWYAKRCLGSYDLRSSLILNIPIPENISPNYCESVEKNVDALLSLEKKYLEDANKLNLVTQQEQECDISEIEEQILTLTNKHNEKAGVLMGQIDALFYDFFGLSDNEIEFIEQELKSSSLAIFPIKNTEEEIE